MRGTQTESRALGLECGRRGGTCEEAGKEPAVREGEDLGHGGKNVLEVGETAFRGPWQGHEPVYWAGPLGGPPWGPW